MSGSSEGAVEEVADEPARGGAFRWIVMAGAMTAIVLGTGIVWARARSKPTAMSAAPKPVGVITPRQAAFQPTRTYVGTAEPWQSASIGPQIVSAFVESVRVRPGARVAEGEVLATLDCRSASSTMQAASMQARALAARQRATSREAERVRSLVDGGFVSANDAELKDAESAAQEAQLLAQRAKIRGSALEVSDCALRAPFAGEVSARAIDPGAFVRPGTTLVSIVDRSLVRIAVDAPERDYELTTPGRPVRLHLWAGQRDLEGQIARRYPAADAATRTVRFEVDVKDDERKIAVGTTVELSLDAGEPIQALAVPLAAASVRGKKAAVFVVEGGVAKKRSLAVVGERAGEVYLERSLPEGATLVLDGRALLADGDKVDARPAAR